MADLEEVFKTLESKTVAIQKDNNLTIIDSFEWTINNNIYNIGNMQIKEYIYVEESLGDYFIWLNNKEAIILEIL